MKSTFKILISVLALGVMASVPALRAQADTKAPPADQGAKGGKGGGRGGQSPEQRLAAIDAAVTLTADQKTKITAILTDSQKEMQDARAAAGGDRQAMMTKMQEINKKSHEAIKALLTAEQQPKFDAMPQQGPGGRRGGGGGAGGGAPKTGN